MTIDITGRRTCVMAAEMSLVDPALGAQAIVNAEVHFAVIAPHLVTLVRRAAEKHGVPRCPAHQR